MANSKPRMLSPQTARRLICILGLLVIGALVSACGGGGACTAELRTSVLVTVVDQFSAPLSGVTVTYQVNGGTTQSQAHEFNGTYGIAFEVSGLFTIAASKPGYTTSSGSVTVNRDECHVITERITLMLQSGT